jgi:hypothetical protein
VGRPEAKAAIDRRPARLMGRRALAVDAAPTALARRRRESGRITPPPSATGLIVSLPIHLVASNGGERCRGI